MALRDDHPDLRTALCAGMRELERLGLNRGTAGNASVRTADGFLITPSGVPPRALAAASIVAMRTDGAVIERSQRPSSEWRFHCAIYAARPEIGAVAHTHSSHATALACLRRDLPPFHYMVAIAGGSDIRCAPYATFGSEELSHAALAALAGRRACLLANHGVIALGADLDQAIALAAEVEELARQYHLARCGGEPVLLSAQEMQTVIEKFATYGARHGQDHD